MVEKHLPQTIFEVPAAPPPTLYNAMHIIDGMSMDAGWRRNSLRDHSHAIAGDYARSSAVLDHSDFKRLFLDNTITGQKFGQGAYDLLKKWSHGKEPSLSSILLRAGEHFGVSEKDQGFLALAGILGTEETNLDYHNAEHNRKVVLQATRLAAASEDLTPHDKAKLMIAAAIHDIGHDGKGNGMGESHVQYRLEKQSFELAKPYLEKMGMSADDLEDIRTMIFGTDISPMGSPTAPQRRITEGKDFPAELSRLESDPKLLKMTRMLAIADIACSSSLHPDQADYETRNVAKETGKDTSQMKDEDVAKFYGFFAQNCGGILETVPEAAHVYGDNHKHVYENMMMKKKDLPCAR